MAGGTTADEVKKSVCKAFTSVVKSSTLAINPKTFFMMINTNYPVLVRGDRMELGPLWDAMSSGHPVDQLYGVFLMFRIKAMDLGLKVLLPKDVDSLSDEEMRKAMQPWTGVMFADEPTLDPMVPVALSTDDVKPFVPEELRRRIIGVVSSAIRSSPLATQIDPAMLTFHIDSGFDVLFNGHTFDFAQVFEAVRRTQDLDDRQVYEAIARARNELESMQLGVVEPTLDLSPQEREAVENEIMRAEQRAARERAQGMQIVPSPAVQKEKTPEDGTKRPEKDRLKEYGLSSVREKKRPIRAILLGSFVAVLAVVSFIFRPSRSVSTDPYDAVMPMKSAELVSGKFQCLIDGDRWFKLPVKEREERITKLEAILREQGRLDDMQCRDARNRLVLSASGNGRLLGAAFFVRGDAAGKIPKEESAPVAAPLADKK